MNRSRLLTAALTDALDGRIASAPTRRLQRPRVSPPATRLSRTQAAGPYRSAPVNPDCAFGPLALALHADSTLLAALPIHRHVAYAYSTDRLHRAVPSYKG